MKLSYCYLCAISLSTFTMPVLAQTELNPAASPTNAIPAGSGSGATGQSGGNPATGAITNSSVAVPSSMFSALDANADGMISRVEFESYRAASPHLPTRGAGSPNSGSGATGNAISGTLNFDLLDVNSDGMLNAEEFARSAYNEASEGFAGAPRAVQRTVGVPGDSLPVGIAANKGGPALFPAADTNSDGLISRQEFARYHNAVNEGLDGKKDAMDSFQALDADSDGMLTAIEFARGNSRGDLQDGTDTSTRTVIESTTTTIRPAQ